LGLGVAAGELVAWISITRATPAMRECLDLFLVHASILAASLVALRGVTELNWRAASRRRINRNAYQNKVNTLIVSSGGISPLMIKLLRDQLQGVRLVGLLDEDSVYSGRNIGGVSVLGSPGDLEAVIDEYKIHGVDVGCVLFAGLMSAYPEYLIKKVSEVCRLRQMTYHSLFDYLAHGSSDQRSTVLRDIAVQSEISLPRYMLWKRLIDFVIASIMLILLLPVLVGVAAIVFLDVGAPIIFWQERVGVRGRGFFLYKFRTMRAPQFDQQYRKTQRLSRIGQLLRDTSLDELPQLFNVVLGDMSIIGPRPLLPVDQPKVTSVRLSVRPGITGWAQINGRKNLDPDEKERFDSWYVRNASLRLDLLILVKTARMIFDAALRRDRADDERVQFQVSSQIMMESSQGAE
jgi:lipopolysaccharide/colanic/teichoic acid biosynthesis glycosyltransferase